MKLKDLNFYEVKVPVMEFVSATIAIPKIYQSVAEDIIKDALMRDILNPSNDFDSEGESDFGEVEINQINSEESNFYMTKKLVVPSSTPDEYMSYRTRINVADFVLVHDDISNKTKVQLR
jgi:hypothetical protein